MAPRQIMVLRHAEKPSDDTDPNLSLAGELRAKMLASLIPQRFPNQIFSSPPLRRMTAIALWRLSRRWRRSSG
jgi:hypothetical protein